MKYAIFQLEDVAKRYAGPQGQAGFELQVPSLEIFEAQRVGIVAESGFGKSTLLDLLVFASRPSGGGTFEFNVPKSPSSDILAEWRRGRTRVFSTLRKRHIGVVLQTGGLLPFLTARGNIELPVRLSGNAPPVPVEELAARLDISRQLEHFPRQLSIGQRQRVAIARALVHHPLVIVADEPTASLDRGNASKVMSMLVELTEVVGVTLIVATHDPHLVADYGFDVLHHDYKLVDGATHSRFWN